MNLEKHSKQKLWVKGKGWGGGEKRYKERGSKSEVRTTVKALEKKIESMGEGFFSG